MYTITHPYLTADDEGNAIVETEAYATNDPSFVAKIVADMLAHPGGRSGTTITMTVSIDGTAAL